MFLHIVECQRTRAGTGIVWTGKGSIQLVMYDDQLCICGASRVGSVVWNVTDNYLTFYSIYSTRRVVYINETYDF